MKKILLLLASLAMSAASFAQWEKPAPSKVQEMATDGTAQFLYNKEAGGFFAGANDWGTRASVATSADSIKFISLGNDLYNFGCYPASKNKWLYVSCNAFDAMWVDASNNVGSSNYPGTDAWQIKKQANGSYKISNTTISGNYTFGVAEIYRGLSGNTRCYINDVEDVYDVNGENMPSIPEGAKFYDEWYFIDSVEYKALQPKVVVYLASVDLKGAIDAVKAEDENYNTASLDKVYNNTSSTKEELDAAKAIANAAIAFHQALVTAQTTYPNLDFSAPTNIYNNVDATEAELIAAAGDVQTIVTEYLATQASFESPIDYSSVIGDGSDATPWTRIFTGEGEVGSHTTNTWSTEANGGADGTDMTTPFIEHWTSSGGILSDQKIYQVLKGAAPGLYKFSANVRLYNEKGDVESLTGCTMYFGNEAIDLSSQVSTYTSSGKKVLWKEGGFNIIAIVKEAGDIELGFDIKDATFNWIAFKGTSLLYYGNENVEENASKLVKESYSYVKYEGTDAMPELIEAYNSAVEAFNAATEAADINAAAAEAATAKNALDANIKAYKNLFSKIESWEKAISEKQDLAGDLWDAFSDFMQGDPGDTYPAVTPVEIAEGDRSLSTEEITAYIETVEKLYAEAIAASVVEGGDCSEMLVNPKFTDPNGAGWTKSGNVTLYGGLHNFPCAESWHSKFDVYQDVEGVPDGIYSVSLNGFCRLDGEAKVAGQIYMNDYYSEMKDIDDVNELVATTDAVDGVNCYLSTGSDGAWTKNPIFWVDEDGTPCTWNSPNNATDTTNDHDGVNYYAPNGMEGASVAFSAGRYKATVYGFVSGGKMRLGVRCNSAGQWVLWSNFTLIYEGKSAAAMKAILPGYIETLENYVAENEDYNMTAPVVADSKTTIDAAKDALSSEDGDLMWEYVEKCNSTLVNAKKNVELVEKYNSLLESINANYDASNADAKAQFDAIAAEVGDYASLDNEGLEALIAKMEEIDAALRVPDYSNASDETPVTMTQMITNPDFEANTAGQQATGWTLVKGEGAEGNYQTQTGYDDGVSMEFWSNSNGSKTIFDFYQVLTGLPAGTYEITAEASNSLNDQTAGPGEGRAYIYAGAGKGEEVRTVLSDPIEIQESGCRDARNTYTVVVKLGEGEDLYIGAKSIGELSARWVMVDNYTLTYYGPASAKEESPADASAIVVANAPVVTASAIYNAAGSRVAKLQKGLNIVKMSDGSVKKIMIK